MSPKSHQEQVENLLESAKRKRIALAQETTENEQLIALLTKQLSRFNAKGTAESHPENGEAGAVRQEKRKVSLSPLTREQIEEVLSDGPMVLNKIVERLQGINPTSRSNVHRFLTQASRDWIVKTGHGYSLRSAL